MGNKSTAAMHQQLTQYAFGLSNDMSMGLAQFMAPLVAVGAAQGRYKAYNATQAFQIYNTERAMGGPATRIQFSATDPTFDCRAQALEATIDDQERDAAGASSGLEQSRVRDLVSLARLAYEAKVFALAAANVTAVSGKGVWGGTTGAGNDPIAQIDEQISDLTTDMGVMPNRMVMGLGAWLLFKNHPKVISRFPGAQKIGITKDQATGLFLNPAIQVQVGTVAKDGVKLGGTSSKTNIVGADVWIFYASDAPSQYDPSFMKTFRTSLGGVEAVRSYRDENARSDVYALDWSEDVKITGSACVKRLTISSAS